MFIKKITPVQTTRAWECTDQINKLKTTYLKHPYIRGFIHDITYGKGRFSILTDNKDYLKYFYVNQLPAFFTDEFGRFLPNGVYFTHMFPLKDKERQIIDTLSQTFHFDYLIHIVKHQGDIQHTYSFLMQCHETQLMFFVANQLAHLRQFISIYERQCSEMIEFVKADKNHLILPYSEGTLEDFSEVLQSYLVRDELQPNALVIPHALDHQWVKLTPQQVNCFQLLLQGYTAKEIAFRMNLSYRTIQHYTATIYERLGLESSRELIVHYSYLLN